MTRHFIKLLGNIMANVRNNSTNICADGGNLIRTVEKNGIREIILNDMKTRNALSLAMMVELYEAITKNLHCNDLRIILLTSPPNSIFSSGHDLKELTEEKGTNAHRKIFAQITEIVLAIRKAPVPVIAKIDGPTIGAGCQLAASCDILICSDRSTFSLAATDYGLFASTPAVAVSRVMPKMKSAHLLLSGLPMTAQQANIAGLVSYVVPSDKLDEEVNRVCDSILKKSRSVLQLGKEFFYKQMEMNLLDAYKAAENKMVENLLLDDGKEGVKSFVEKRKPNWSKL